MNRKQQRILESRIREVMDEPVKLTEDEIEAIRERARRAYQESMNQERQAQQSRHKKSGVLRRVVAVFAIAVGLIVTPVLYTALVPVTIGNADSFIRRAAIWVNDQLHLGIEFPKPKDEPEQVVIKEPKSFSSFEEAHKELNIPLVCVTGMDELILDEINAYPQEESLYITIQYKLDGELVSIFMEPSWDFDKVSDKINILTEELSMMETTLGTVYIWENEIGKHAFTFVNNYQVELFSTISIEHFSKICQALDLID